MVNIGGHDLSKRSNGDTLCICSPPEVTRQAWKSVVTSVI